MELIVIWGSSHMDDEWMMHLYYASLCIAVHPKCFTIMGGGCAASTWQPQYNGASRLIKNQRQVERRESHRIKWVGIIGGHDWQGPVVGIWPGHRSYTPTLYDKCYGIFNDHRESGTRFNVSSERQCFLGLYLSQQLRFWVINPIT